MKKKSTLSFEAKNVPKFKWSTVFLLCLFTGGYINAGNLSKKADLSGNNKITLSPPAPLVDECPPISTLPCDQLSVSLPYSLSFSSGVANTLADKNGLGTGFSLAKAY